MMTTRFVVKWALFFSMCTSFSHLTLSTTPAPLFSANREEPLQRHAGEGRQVEGKCAVEGSVHPLTEMLHGCAEGIR